MQLPATAVLDRRSRRNEKFVHAREPSLEPTKHLEPCPHGSREPSEGRRLARTSRPVERIRGRADRLPSGIRGGCSGLSQPVMNSTSGRLQLAIDLSQLLLRRSTFLFGLSTPTVVTRGPASPGEVRVRVRWPCLPAAVPQPSRPKT